MRYVEFQILSARLAELLTFSLRSQDLAPGLVLPAGKAEILVDRVEVQDVYFVRGSATSFDVEWDDGYGQKTFVPVTAHELGYDILLNVYLSLLRGRGTANPLRSELSFFSVPTTTCTVRLDIEGAVTNGTPQLILRPLHATLPEGSFLDDALSDLGFSAWDQAGLRVQFEAELLNAVPVRTIDLPLAGADQLPLEFVAAGVATDAQQRRLVVRFQTTPRVQAAVAQWQNLFDGDVQHALRDNYPGGPDDEWAILMERAIVQDVVTERVYDWIHDAHGGDIQRNVRLGLKSGPEAVLQPDDVVRVEIDFWWDVQIDAPIHPEAHAHVVVLLQIAADGSLELQTTVNVTLDSADALLFGWIVDSLAPVLGRRIVSHLVNVFAPTVSVSFTSGFLGGAFFAEPVISVGADLSASLPRDDLTWQCEMLQSNRQICFAEASASLFAKSAQLRQQGLGVHLDQVLGIDDALVARGHLSIPQPQPHPELDDAVAGEPHWNPVDVPCARAGGAGRELAQLAVNPLASFDCDAHIGVAGRYRLVIVAATLVSSDPAGVVAAIDIDQHYLDVRVRFRPNAAYESAPYPFSVLVQTNAGSRLVHVDPIPKMTPELAKQLVIQSFGRVARCFALVDAFYAEFHRLNRRLTGDPGPELREVVAQVWRVFEAHLGETRDLAPIGERVSGREEERI
jgi:hypothetical protein